MVEPQFNSMHVQTRCSTQETEEETTDHEEEEGDYAEFFPPLAVEVSVDSPLKRVVYMMRGPP
eukprot:5209214-Amphidinium_carterae.1